MGSGNPRFVQSRIKHCNAITLILLPLNRYPQILLHCPELVSGDTKGEKRSIDFEVIFHYLCHTSHPLATPKMKYSGFCATNIEKFPVYKNLETVVRFRTTGFQVFIRKLLVCQFKNGYSGTRSATTNDPLPATFLPCPGLQ